MKNMKILGTLTFGAMLTACNVQPQTAASTEATLSTESDQEMVNESSNSALSVAVDLQADAFTAQANGGANAFLFPRIKEANCPTVAKEQVDANTVKITSTFDNCQTGGILRLRDKLSYDGRTIRTLSKEVDDTGAVVKRSSQVDRQLTIEGLGERKLSIDALNKYSHEGTFPNIHSTANLDIKRERVGIAGQVIRSYSIQGSLDYVSSGSSTIEKIVANGDVDLKEEKAGRSVSYSFKDVTWSNTCAHPISGTITKAIVNADGSHEDKSLVFSGDCGSAASSGEANLSLSEPELE